MKRLLLIATALGVVALIVFLMQPEPPVVDVIEVQQGTIHDFIDEQGMTRLSHIHRVTMPLDGRVLAIDLIEGSTVSQDEPVAQLDPSDLQTEVARAEARVRELEAELNVNRDNRLEDGALKEIGKLLESMSRMLDASRAQTKSSEAQLRLAEQQYQRQLKLRGSSATTGETFEQAEVNRITNQIDRDKDVLNLRALEALDAGMNLWPTQISNWISRKTLQRAVLEAQRDEAVERLQQARRDLERVELKSPVSGVVLTRAVENERVLRAGELLLEIGDLDQLEVEADLLSLDAVAVQVGQPVEIETPSFADRPLRGTVARVFPQGFTKLSSLGVEQQRVKTIVAFDPGELDQLRTRHQQLGTGYRVRVRIYTAQRDQTLFVPRSSLFQATNGEWQALRAADDGTLELVPVELGLVNDQQAEILQGLGPADRVVLVPDGELTVGSRISPRVVTPALTSDRRMY